MIVTLLVTIDFSGFLLWKKALRFVGSLQKIPSDKLRSHNSAMSRRQTRLKVATSVCRICKNTARDAVEAGYPADRFHAFSRVPN
jgi:hypothetical protein